MHFQEFDGDDALASASTQTPLRKLSGSISSGSSRQLSEKQ